MDLIDRQALLKQIDIDSDGEPGYYGDTWKFIDTIKSMPPAELGTNLASLDTDCISRQQAIDDIWTVSPLACLDRKWVDRWLRQLPPIQPKRGKWLEDKGQQTLMKNFIEMGEVWRVCSVCGAGHMIGHKYAIDKAYHDRHHNFCPNCGADMREVTT